MNQGYEFLKGVKGINQSIIPFLPDESMDVCEDNLNMFFKAMFERQEIWYKRNIKREPRPWTKDEIFKDYKFTNVYRELDRSSQFLIKHVLLNFDQKPEDVVFRAFVYRIYNIPDTFTHVDSEVRLQPYSYFDSDWLWIDTRKYRNKVGNPWHTAYMMNVAGIMSKPSDWKDDITGMFKDYVYCKVVMESLHENIPNIMKAKTIKDFISAVEKVKGLSSFMSHELFLDAILINKYWKQKIFPDFTENDFTNVGPGASLGIKLIFPSLQPKEQIDAIYWLRDLSKEYLAKNGDFKYIKWNKSKKIYELGRHNITLHTVEFWLCEFSKYFKILIKKGKQRSKFIPRTL
jgi:hypothetical protein